MKTIRVSCLVDLWKAHTSQMWMLHASFVLLADSCAKLRYRSYERQVLASNISPMPHLLRVTTRALWKRCQFGRSRAHCAKDALFYCLRTASSQSRYVSFCYLCLSQPHGSPTASALSQVKVVWCELSFQICSSLRQEIKCLRRHATSKADATNPASLCRQTTMAFTMEKSKQGLSKLAQQRDPLASLEMRGVVVPHFGPDIETRVPAVDVAMVRFQRIQ